MHDISVSIRIMPTLRAGAVLLIFGFWTSS
jgi:hypothetical protein